MEQSNKEQPLNYTHYQLPFGEFVKRILALGFLVIVALTIWELRLILLLSFLAIVIAVSLDIPVRGLEKRGFRRGVAIFVVVVLAFTGLITIGGFIGSILVVQTQNLVEELPQAIDNVRDDYNELADRVIFLPPIDVSVSASDQEDISGIINADTLTGGAAFITSVGSLVLSIAFNLFIVIVVAIYLLLDPQTYANSILSLIPKDRHVRILEIMIDLRHALVGWLVTQLFSMTITAIMVGFMLGVVWGIPNAIALAVIAGLLTFIPNFGPFISMIPGIIFTLTDRPALVIPVIITYIVIQQLESSIITPMMVRYRLSVPAAAILIFQVMCGVLFGFMGLLLAVPIFLVVRVLVRDLYVKDVLDNINTAVEARNTDEGKTVFRIIGNQYATAEIPLKEIFQGENPFERTVAQVIKQISADEKQTPKKPAKD